jgi:hypothetical protein
MDEGGRIKTARRNYSARCFCLCEICVKLKKVCLNIPKAGATMKKTLIFLIGISLFVPQQGWAGLEPSAPTPVTPLPPTQQVVTLTKEKQLSGFTEVPKGHWTYEAIAVLADAGIAEFDLRHRIKNDALLTRYDFALAMGRFSRAESIKTTSYGQGVLQAITNHFNKIQNAKTKSNDEKTAQINRQEAQDIIAALSCEFSSQLEVMGLENDRNGCSRR